MELLISLISSVHLVDSPKLTDCVCVCGVYVCVCPVADDSAVLLCIRGGTSDSSEILQKRKK